MAAPGVLILDDGELDDADVLGAEPLPTGDLGGVHEPRALVESNLQEVAEAIVLCSRNMHIEQELIKEYIRLNIDYSACST